MCKRVPENNSPTAALQITVEAERKHISSLVVLHKSRHFAMRQRHQPQIPPRESGPFQFSLTFFISESCSVFFFSISPCKWHFFWFSFAFPSREENEATGDHSGRSWFVCSSSTHPAEPRGAWRPEGPRLPATPRALVEKRSPSCWATLTYISSLTHWPPERKIWSCLLWQNTWTWIRFNSRSENGSIMVYVSHQLILILRGRLHN